MPAAPMSAAAPFEMSLAHDLVELAPEVGEERLAAKFTKEGTRMFSGLRVREVEAHLPLVGVASEAAFPKVPIEAVLHGKPGVVALQGLLVDRLDDHTQ